MVCLNYEIDSKGLDKNGGSCDNVSKQASKQSVALPFFPAKLKTAQKQKAYSARFHTGGMRLFCVSPDSKN